jgi:hypothetical protein
MAKVEAKIVDLTPEQEGERTLILKQWESAKLALESAKTIEMDLRKIVMAYVFADAEVGTNRVSLGNGWAIKGVRKISYSLEKDTAKVGTIDEQIRALGNEGPVIAERILKRVYDFSESEYKKLDVAMPTQLAAKKLIDSILTTKDAAPTLELEAPK